MKLSTSITTFAVLVLVLVAGAGAQRTWIVDAAGGPGSNFTDIPPAVAAAAPGDTILVLDGIYNPFSTGKGIRVLGSANTVMSFLSFAPIVVQNLPANETFVMENLHSRLFPGPLRIELLDNAGAVHIEHTDATSRLVVDGCVHVTLANLALTDVDVTDSLVTMAGVRATGMGSFAGSFPALTAVRSVLLLSESEIVGPSRNSPGPFGTFNGPGIELDASRVAVSAGSCIVAGDDVFRLVPMPAILATRSTIEVDPGAVLTGANGSPPIVTDRPVTRRLIPGLSAIGGPPGGALFVALGAPPLAPALVALSVPTTPVRIPGLGDIGLDPASLAIVFSAAAPSTGRVNVTVPIPPLPVIVGTPITAQGLVARGAALTTSQPATVVLR